MAALNIASLSKHTCIDELRNYMISKPVDILAINETRLDCSFPDSAVSIPGYSLDRKDRNRNGGGVALYIRNSIAYEIILTLDEKLELLCVKVIKPKAKPFIVGTWYRPPGSTNEIMQAFGSALEKLEQHHLETNILGDFNCDIAAIGSSN